MIKKDKLEIKIGQIVEVKRNGIQGIVLEMFGRPGTYGYYGFAAIYCIFAPGNSSLVGYTLDLNVDGLKAVGENAA